MGWMVKAFENLQGRGSGTSSFTVLYVVSPAVVLASCGPLLPHSTFNPTLILRIIVLGKENVPSKTHWCALDGRTERKERQKLLASRGN